MKNLSEGVKALRAYNKMIEEIVELKAYPPFSTMPKDPNGDLEFPRPTPIGEKFGEAIRKEMDRIHSLSKNAETEEDLTPEMFARPFSTLSIEFADDLEEARLYKKRYSDPIVALEAAQEIYKEPETEPKK
jgi:hypothetical protein